MAVNGNRETPVIRLVLIVIFLYAGGCDMQTTRPAAAPGPKAVDLPALRTLADQAYDAGDWQSAAHQYTSLCEQEPARAENWFRLGNTQAYLGRLDAAVAAYQQAVSRSPDFTKAWHNLGIARLRQAADAFAALQAHAREDDPLKAEAADIVHTLENAVSDGSGGTP